MPEDEKHRFAEALEHWAEAVEEIRARERSQAISRVEELQKERLRRDFHSSDLSKHHARKDRH